MLMYFYKDFFLKIKPHPFIIHINRLKDNTQNSEYQYPGESIVTEQVKCQQWNSETDSSTINLALDTIRVVFRKREYLLFYE